MVQSGRVQQIDSVVWKQKQQSARHRDLVAMAMSGFIHALLLLLLAVFVLPSMISGGKQVLEVSLGEADTFSLDPTDLPVLMPPSLAEPSNVPAKIPDVFVLPELEIALTEPKKLGNESEAATPSAAASPSAGSPSVSGTVEGAVDRITGELNSKLEKGDLLVVWLLDASNSLVDDRQRVAARLKPFYESLVAKRSSFQHQLRSAVVSYGATMRERVPPTEFGDKIIAAVEDLPIDKTGKEKVFDAVAKCAEHYRQAWPDRQLLLVIWTDESGDDFENLESAIAVCRQQNVSVSVVGPSSVLGAETGLHAYTDPKSQETYQLPVLRGPETAMPERLNLGYWYLTRLREQGRGRGELPTWIGGQDLAGILSGFSPYALTRLTMQTGGTYTIFDRPEDRDPFNPTVMQRYAPSYGSLAEYRDDVQSHPIRRAVLNAVAELEGQDVDEPPRMLFIKQTGERFFDFVRLYFTPNEFRSKLRTSSSRLKGQATRSTRIVEAALEHVSESGNLKQGLEELYRQEQSPRWRAWYDLTRGRLLATSVRLEEYRLTIDALGKTGALAETTNHVMLVAVPEMRSSEPFTQRSAEAQQLLERCVRENQGTPWETLAQRELEFALGVGAREMALTPEPLGPDTKQPSLPRF